MVVASTRLEEPEMLKSAAVWCPSFGRPKPLMVSLCKKDILGWQYIKSFSCTGPCVRAACAVRKHTRGDVLAEFEVLVKVLLVGLVARKHKGCATSTGVGSP